MSTASTPTRSHRKRREEVPAPDTYPFWVLVEPPVATWVPIFGLIGHFRRERVEKTVLTDHEAVKGAVSGNTARALRAGRYGDHHRVNLRERLSDREALYSSWLAFDRQEDAEAFIRDHRRYGLGNIKARTAVGITQHQRRLANGISKGRYDLSRLEEDARLGRAREYAEIANELRKLQDTAYALRKLEANLPISPVSRSVG